MCKAILTGLARIEYRKLTASHTKPTEMQTARQTELIKLYAGKNTVRNIFRLGRQ